MLRFQQYQFTLVCLLLVFLAATIVPLGSEGMVVYRVTRGYNITAVVIIASIGNYLGACTIYLLGRIWREKLLEKYMKINQDELKRLKKYSTNMDLLRCYLRGFQ
jgi:membrane protein YqaA with SNARE-associated domain